MKPITMIKRCNEILGKLDQLESCAVSMSSDNLKWLYTTVRSLNELKHVAKFETKYQMTPFQVDHIHMIQAECDAAIEEFTSSDNAED
jgi:hypothetical protein